MITERLTFRAKYGHGDELVALFREFYPKLRAAGVLQARLYTDATGPMFTVVAESDFPDMAAYAAFFSDSSMYADPEFAGWFARMMAATESGDRQLFHMEVMG